MPGSPDGSRQTGEDEVVVGVVVGTNQSFGAVRIAEDPRAEFFLDELLLLPSRQCFLLVEDSLFMTVHDDRVVDGRGLHVEGQFQQMRSVGSRCSVVRRGWHGMFGRVVRRETPDSVFLEM